MAIATTVMNARKGGKGNSKGGKGNKGSGNKGGSTPPPKTGSTPPKKGKKSSQKKKDKKSSKQLLKITKNPVKSLFGQIALKIRQKKPKTWEEKKPNRGHGWKWVDENGKDRLRFMYPNKNGRFPHEKKGYWRWYDEKGNSLDMWGNVVDPFDLDFNGKVHIIYSGVKL